jgi:membrane protein YdbS with pleckstrin-like domain
VNTLHPHVKALWRISGLFAALLFGAAAATLEALLSGRGVTLLFPGFATGVAAAASLLFALIFPNLRYRYWRWDIEPERITIQKGVVWRSRSVIPRVRVQHVDTRTSPLQRWLGLSSLIIYTAGTRGADAEIPGLTGDDAERLREELARLEELDELA